MKHSTSLALAVAAGLTLITAHVRAESPAPGLVDFGTFTAPRGGGEFVEVNLTGNLIGMAARLVEKQEPEVAQLLKGIQLVRVNVIGLTDENRPELEGRMQDVRKSLDGKGWERVVNVQQQNQDVGVYLKTKDQDTVQGLVVVVKDGTKQAVFVNVVGNIKPEQLSLLGERLHIDPLKDLGRAAGK